MNRFLLSIFALILALFAGARVARATDLDYTELARIPVQDGGRIMPMDSYARLRLLQFSGRSTFGKRPAIEWLARLVFDPAHSQTDTVFLVNNPEVLEAMGLDDLSGRRFSYDQLRPGLEKLRELASAAAQHEENQRNPVEKEFLRVYHNITTFASLGASFRFAVPHPDFTVTNAVLRAQLNLPADQENFSFLDMHTHAKSLSADIQRLAARPPESWSADESDLFALSSTLFNWSRYYRDLPIAMLPIPAHNEEQWISPWDKLAFGALDDTSSNELFAMQNMAQAWLAGRNAEFKLAAHSVARSIASRAEENRALLHLNLELTYNRIDPLYRAQILYGFAFLLSLVALLRTSTLLRRFTLAGIALALIPHTYGIVARMMIMGRPPMTNLYATFIFVAWVCVVLGLAVEWYQRNGLGAFLSAVSGLVLLMISNRFEMQNDTMGVVIAVLDSNFWLSTHVVTITIGYAGCIAAGLAGHIYLLQALKYPDNHPALRSSARAVYGLLAFGLIFSFLGTMLGGVWADQSWGRFWGWDPKENGALLIVLWCSILFHARWAAMIGNLGVAAGSVLGVIVVLFAWIGVNLLGVGLHSYGFTSGVALGLWIAVAIELLFVAITVPVIYARRRPITS
ncbi:MAG: cytochrome c biogenesis protein CcsA [Kiritimatiellae bacterium]|nr:cytochrome c biogenesis protein CcsA [Kiritimatiellia bacterium]